MVMSSESGSFIKPNELSIYVEDHGSGVPVLLLHGWPDDVRTWDGVAARLNAAGFRTIAPFLRGFGRTRFRNAVERRLTSLAGAVFRSAAIFASRWPNPESPRRSSPSSPLLRRRRR